MWFTRSLSFQYSLSCWRAKSATVPPYCAPKCSCPWVLFFCRSDEILQYFSHRRAEDSRCNKEPPLIKRLNLDQTFTDSSKCQYCLALSSGASSFSYKGQINTQSRNSLSWFPSVLRTILESVNSSLQVNIWIPLQLAMLGHDGHAVCADQLAGGRFIGSSQVKEVVHRVAGLTFAHQVIILGLADHLAAMGDGLHVILILMARLIQGILGKRQEERLIRQQDNPNVAFTLAFLKW